MLAKTWRIKKIIGETRKLQGQNLGWKSKILIFLRLKNPNKSKKKKNMQFKKAEVITWKRLLIVLGFIVGGELILLSIYTIIAPFFDLTTKVVNSDTYESENYTRCEYNAVFATFAILLAVYNLLLMIYGVFLSWMLRNVQWTLFNESKAIVFAITILISLLSSSVQRESSFLTLQQSLPSIIALGLAFGFTLR